jgi:hypothetical protein
MNSYEAEAIELRETPGVTKGEHSIADVFEE